MSPTQELSLSRLVLYHDYEEKRHLKSTLYFRKEKKFPEEKKEGVGL